MTHLALHTQEGVSNFRKGAEMATKTDDIVVFNRFNAETNKWEEVSNDPRWHAKKRLAEAEAEAVPDAAALAAQREAEVAAQIKSSEKAQSGPAPTGSGENYNILDGKALKALAEQRGIDLAAIKKVNAGKLSKKALIAALVEHTAAHAPVVITGADVVDLNQPAPPPTLALVPEADAEGDDDEDDSDDGDAGEDEDDAEDDDGE